MELHPAAGHPQNSAQNVLRPSAERLSAWAAMAASRAAGTSLPTPNHGA